MDDQKMPDEPTLAALQEWFSVEARYRYFHPNVVERMERTLAAAGKAAREAAPTRSIVDPVELTYTNWRGETAVRKIRPLHIWFGATDWHPEAQWLLRAFDVEKQAERDFALKDFGAPSSSSEIEALQVENAELREAPKWQPMDTAPLDGKHCILAIRTECGCFVYSIQGAFMQGEWMNAANIKTEPLAWMPNVLLPDEFCPWTDQYKARAALQQRGKDDG